MNLHINLGIAGRYRLRKFVGDACTGDTGWFDNLILNNGLDQIANVTGGSFGFPYLFTVAFVGTGTTPPADTDSQLESYLASSSGNEQGTTSFVEAAGAVPAYWRGIRILTFGTGVAAGTISEVGVGKSSTNLFSRALIVDSNGNPTTITVLSNETLQVTYEYRSYLDKTDHLTTADIGGVTYNVTYRLADIDNPPQILKGLGLGGDASNNLQMWSGSMGTVYNVPTGSSTAANYYVNRQPYNVGDYFATFVFTFGLSTGNFGGGGVLSMLFNGNQYRFQMQFTPRIPKDATNILTMNMQVSWGRYTP
jgi:hypothetical protein